MTVHEIYDEQHDEWTPRLSEYLDDELSAGERQALEQHLEACASCAGTLDDLRRVIATARSLPQTPPGEHVWRGVAERIGNLPATARTAAPGRFAFTVPQLIAASVLLTLLSGWAAMRLVGPAAPSSSAAVRPPAEAGTAIQTPVSLEPEFSANDPQYDAAVGDLEQALERGRGRLDPGTVETVENDLRIIDQALDEARRALLADPANGYLSGHMIETRQRKLDLLRRAAALTTDTQM